MREEFPTVPLLLLVALAYLMAFASAVMLEASRPDLVALVPAGMIFFIATLAEMGEPR